MRRRSKLGGDSVKKRCHKAVMLKRSNAPKVVRRRNFSDASQIARLSRELAEARERQTATSQVLSVISSSPGELEPVFQAMLENATRICEAEFGLLYLVEGDAYRTGK